MADIYIKYTPVRRGLTGAEFIAGFLDENFTGVTFNGIVSEGMNHYGVLSGSGDALSNALLAIEGRFSIMKLDRSQFIGMCKSMYVPNPDPIGDSTALTFIEFMDNAGITVLESEVLPAVKKAKRLLFKEIIKKELQPNNDNISALTKAIVLHLFHYDNLTPEEKTQVDTDTTALIAIYTKGMCISAYGDMVSELTTELTNYYTAVINLESQSTVDDALACVYNPSS